MSIFLPVHKGKVYRVSTNKTPRKHSAKSLLIMPEVDPLVSSVAVVDTSKELRVPPIEAHQFIPSQSQGSFTTPRNEAQQVDDFVC